MAGVAGSSPAARIEIERNLMGLKEEIKKIVELQKIDSEIYDLTQKKDNLIPQESKALHDEFEEIAKSLLVFENKIKNLQLQKKDREIDLASKEEALKKAQGQLYQLKTNKEYQAKLNEIESHKADISVAEEEVLKILEELESAKKEFQQQKTQLQAEENKIKEKQRALTAAIQDAEVKIEALQSKRETAIDGIDAKVLSRYEHLLKKRHGLAIVPVVDNICGACHMRLTHQNINEIKMFKELVFCGNCVRILYIPDDIER